MMLWVPPVRRRWKARKVKQRGISKAARGLFAEKGDGIEGIWVHGSSRLVSDLQKSGRNGLRIMRVDIKPLIRHRKLRERVVYESIGSREKSSGLGRGSGLLFPKAKMFEDFFMTSSSSMTLMTFMTPEHLGHVSGSTFPDQVRDRVSIAFSLPG